MLNAHLRFGWLQMLKVTTQKTTSFRVRLDRLIVEPAPRRNELAKAHLISVIAGDTQIAAITAGLSEGGRFAVEGPGLASLPVQIGPSKPQTYRATLQLQGRRRPLRHLIAISEELASPMVTTKVVLADSHPQFMWAAVAKLLGLPAMPEWAEWFYDQLLCQNAITPLLGIGCSPVLIHGSREEFLAWLGAGVRSGVLTFPEQNRAVQWPRFGLDHVLRPSEGEEAAPLSESTLPA